MPLDMIHSYLRLYLAFLDILYPEYVFLYWWWWWWWWWLIYYHCHHSHHIHVHYYLSNNYPLHIDFLPFKRSSIPLSPKLNKKSTKSFVSLSSVLVVNSVLISLQSLPNHHSHNPNDYPKKGLTDLQWVAEMVRYWSKASIRCWQRRRVYSGSIHGYLSLESWPCWV